MEIPSYPDSRPLDISDKQLLDKLFELLQSRISELTFAGLFLFRKAHGYRLSVVHDSLVVLGKGYNGRSYFLPPLNGDIARALGVLFDNDLELYGADEIFVRSYMTRNELEIIEDRNSFDYLYLRDELGTLPGNRFHKKKNRINYFTARHVHDIALFSPHHSSECLKLLETWYSVADSEQNDSLRLELEATTEALTMTGELGLEGVVVTVEGAVKAFVLGERLNRETAVCHFEKTDPFMEGLSQTINREFAARLFNDCRYINREQDLGEPGLRNAKLSYHPVELVKKFCIRPKPKL